MKSSNVSEAETPGGYLTQYASQASLVHFTVCSYYNCSCVKSGDGITELIMYSSKQWDAYLEISVYDRSLAMMKA